MALNILAFAMVLALSFGAGPSAWADQWQVDDAASSIAFSGTHAGRDFTGEFTDWTAAITFDPDALDQARVEVSVMVASAETGTRLYDRTLPNQEWFDAEKHPQAVFLADEFSELDDGRYQARGTLTIKGQSVPIVLPFSLGIDGDQAEVTGQVELDRVGLNMGTKSDPDAAWVSQIIPIVITLVARRL
ncbi:MAG: YceI family protein [Pseudomonadota bacterium]